MNKIDKIKTSGRGANNRIPVGINPTIIKDSEMLNNRAESDLNAAEADCFASAFSRNLDRTTEERMNERNKKAKAAENENRFFP